MTHLTEARQCRVKNVAEAANAPGIDYIVYKGTLWLLRVLTAIRGYSCRMLLHGEK